MLRKGASSTGSTAFCADAAISDGGGNARRLSPPTPHSFSFFFSSLHLSFARNEEEEAACLPDAVPMSSTSVVVSTTRAITVIFLRRCANCLPSFSEHLVTTKLAREGVVGKHYCGSAGYTHVTGGKKIRKAFYVQYASYGCVYEY